MGMGLGVLALAPSTFWALTIPEFEAALRGRFGDRSAAAALDEKGLRSLMAQFPDDPF
ncbi:MAG: phage tail assembly chaperone [Pseudomonadota bacterium]